MNPFSSTPSAMSDERSESSGRSAGSRALGEQKGYFATGRTRDVASRLESLDRLAGCIKSNDSRIMQAVTADLGKSAFEVYATETGVVLQELRAIRRGLRKWAKPRRVKTPLAYAISSSRTIREPYGVSLILSPWNYPFQLALAPAIGALAAGNTVVLKPSELAPNTSSLLANMIRDTFEPGLFQVLEGDKDVASDLLDQPFDYVFYTGNTRVGKIVLQKAAEHLTPVTLELGGKSPTIVTEKADIKTAARRVAWGKFLNAGQTCVAPDYCIVHRNVYEAFLEALQHATVALYGERPFESPDYGRIVNDRHVQRISSLMDSGRTVIGGAVDTAHRYIAPTVLRDVDWTHPSMSEEIFGPVLPVLRYNEVQEVYGPIEERDRPLALYVFSEDLGEAREIMRRLSFGGGCINDTIMHVANPWLPFGGVGASGMGRYHGHESFRTFSYMKSIVYHRSRPDFSARYPPYKGKLRLLKKLIR
ncbi:MAG: aldehyde dehydrogenase [Spirochaetota bacterium]